MDRLDSLFPAATDIPEAYRLGEPLEQRDYLVDGHLQRWSTPSTPLSLSRLRSSQLGYSRSKAHIGQDHDAFYLVTVPSRSEVHFEQDGHQISCSPGGFIVERDFDGFTTGKIGKGTGLGLAAVYSLAQQSGGWATIDTREGSGTTMSLYLKPAVPDPDHAPATHPVALTRLRALVVDDEESLAQLDAALSAKYGVQYAAIKAMSKLRGRRAPGSVMVRLVMPSS